MLYDISTLSLAFCLHAAAKYDVRFYLKAIHIKGPLCEATDGHILLRRIDPSQVAPEPLILPRDAADWAVKAAKASKAERVAIEVTDESRRLRLSVGSQSYNSMALDRKYPDADAIIPVHDYDIAPVAISGKLLETLGKAAQTLGKGFSVRIDPQGGACRFDFHSAKGDIVENVGGVVMPYRNTAGRARVPSAK